MIPLIQLNSYPKMWPAIWDFSLLMTRTLPTSLRRLRKLIQYTSMRRARWHHQSKGHRFSLWCFCVKHLPFWNLQICTEKPQNYPKRSEKLWQIPMWSATIVKLNLCSITINALTLMILNMLSGWSNTLSSLFAISKREILVSCSAFWMNAKLSRGMCDSSLCSLKPSISMCFWRTSWRSYLMAPCRR